MAQEVEVKINVNTDKAIQSVDGLSSSMSKVGKQTKDVQKDTIDYGNTLKQHAQQNQSVQKAQQDLSNATGGLSDVMIKSASSIKVVNGGFAGMKTAIIETGIGALVILVGYLVESLAKMITKEEESKKAVEATTRALDEQADSFDELTDKNKFYNDMSMKLAKANGASKDELRKTNQAYLESERKRIQEELNLLEAENFAILKNDNLNEEDRKKALEKVDANMQKLMSLKTKNVRDIQSADTDSRVEDLEAEKEAQQKKRDATDRANQKSIADAKAQRNALKNLEIKYAEDIQNLQDDTEQKKLDRQKERALKELDAIKLSNKEKANAIAEINQDFALKQEALEKSQADKILALQTKLEDDKKNLLAVTEEQKLSLSQERARAQLEKDLLNITTSETQKELARQNLQATFDLQNADLKAKKDQADKDEKVNMIALQLEDDTLSFEEKKALIQEREDILLSNTKLTESQRLKIHKDAVEAEKKIDEAKAKGKVDMMNAVNQSLQIGAKIAGENTEAGKALSIASALINTYQGITAGVKLGYPQAIPAVAMAAFTGFQAVKNILAVKVPNGGGGGGGAGDAMTPPSMSGPSINVVGASQTNAIAETVAQQSQAPIKAYVVGNEVTTQQGLDRNIVNSATLG
jgi:DNA repair exonuclease SbcCD ATPase subunit